MHITSSVFHLHAHNKKNNISKLSGKVCSITPESSTYNNNNNNDNDNNVFIFRGFHIKYRYLTNIWPSLT